MCFVANYLVKKNFVAIFINLMRFTKFDINFEATASKDNIFKMYVSKYAAFLLLISSAKINFAVYFKMTSYYGAYKKHLDFHIIQIVVKVFHTLLV